VEVPSSCEERVLLDSQRIQEICLTEQWHAVPVLHLTDALHWTLCTLPSITHSFNCNKRVRPLRGRPLWGRPCSWVRACCFEAF